MMSRRKNGWLALGAVLMLAGAGCGNTNTSAASPPDEKKKFFSGPSYKEMSPEARKIQDAFSHPQGGPPSGAMPGPTKH